MANFARAAYIIDGSRTPFLKAKNKPGEFSASDLAVYTGRALLLRQNFSPDQLDEAIIGCTLPNPDEANIGRVIARRLGCGAKMPAWTVQRNCASGLQSIDSAAQLIANGRAELILAGGTDAMSQAPLLLNTKMIRFLADFRSAASLGQKLKALGQFRPAMFAPVMALLRGLNDSLSGVNMGQTAEILADQFNISRDQMDEFALRSHQRLAHAIDHHYFSEITPLYDTQGKFYLQDDGLRRETSLEKLSQLKPYFDKLYGLVTAGNSAQITDGAGLILLASEKAIKKYDLPVLAKILDVQWAGVDPLQMGLGPVHAITPILQRQKLNLNTLDYLEINEAFAAQVLACLAAWQDKKYCQKNLSLDKALGEFDQDKLNIDGGSISIGHPIGASGTRLLLHTVQVLKRQQKRLGIASLCIGGGLGGAMLIENVDTIAA